MTEVFNDIAYYFTFPFVRYAMVVAILIALCSSLLGVTLVLKRFSFIGDGLSHVAFGSMAVATVMNLTNNFLLVLPVTIICAILLLRAGQNAKIKGDAALAMLSVGALGIGYLILNLFQTKTTNLAGDVCTTLFGSTTILTLDSGAKLTFGTFTIPVQVLFYIILSLLVTAVFVLFYNKIFAITFDEDFATATGVRARAYNLIFAIIIAVVVVLAMNVVGALLVSALVIFPALSAMRVFKSFLSVTVCSVILSVSCTALGILISIAAGTPVGATIVAVDVVVFAIFSGTGFVMTRRVIKN